MIMNPKLASNEHVKDKAEDEAEEKLKAKDKATEWAFNFQTVTDVYRFLSDFLGRLRPRRTRPQKPPNALGVEESSSP